MKKGKTFADLAVGMTVSIENTVKEQDVIDFARVSGDYNPLHMDEAYAKSTQFGGRIAHGALTASYISAVLGNDLPGPGAVFLELNLKFVRPVRIGNTVISTAEVLEMVERGCRVKLGVKGEVDGKIVMRGEATVMVPSGKAD
ncbi:MAG: MaoC family dehydratase [Hyphomonadaceae bacterium]|nr:MaoC family dehydratase [Hyphomonadaceae bacterium]